jgi:hypothetical protein
MRRCLGNAERLDSVYRANVGADGAHKSVSYNHHLSRSRQICFSRSGIMPIISCTHVFVKAALRIYLHEENSGH